MRKGASASGGLCRPAGAAVSRIFGTERRCGRRMPAGNQTAGGELHPLCAGDREQGLDDAEERYLSRWTVRLSAAVSRVAGRLLRWRELGKRWDSSLRPLAPAASPGFRAPAARTAAAAAAGHRADHPRTWPAPCAVPGTRPAQEGAWSSRGPPPVSQKTGDAGVASYL